MQSYVKWVLVFLLLLVNIFIYTYLDSKSCDYICATVTFPVYLLISGFILAFFPSSFPFRQTMMVAIVFLVFIFTTLVLLDMNSAMKALEDPSKYLGFKRSGIPQYGIWVGLFKANNYYFALISSFSVIVGLGFGKGLRYLIYKAFRRD